MSLYVSPWVYPVWDSLHFLDLGVYFLSTIEKFSTMISSNIFSSPFSSPQAPIIQTLVCLMLSQRPLRLSSFLFILFPLLCWASLIAQLVKNLPAMQETWVQSPGEGKGYPLQYYALENSMDYIVHGVTKSQTQLNNFDFSLFFTFYSVMWQKCPPFCLPGH